MANPRNNRAQLADRSGDPLIAERQANVADPSGGVTVDAEARTAINAILDVLEEHGLMTAS